MSARFCLSANFGELRVLLAPRDSFEVRITQAWVQNLGHPGANHVRFAENAVSRSLVGLPDDPICSFLFSCVLTFLDDLEERTVPSRLALRPRGSSMLMDRALYLDARS